MGTEINSFIEKFKDYADCYTVIGGTACDILMTEAGTDFRATKDIDMILIMEARYKEFAHIFWEFIMEGGYRFGWKNSEKAHFYRFTEPRSGYPAMIELFSREPNYINFIPDGIIPIHIDEDTSSLSAILLNDDYYKFMLTGRRVVSGISVLDTEHLIPFKMYAWLDLKDKKARGEHVNERDLKKHKYDVFRLLQIARRDNKIETNGIVRENIIRFMEEIRMENIPFIQLLLPFEMQEALAYLGEIYR
ncbi:hypothetical protein HMPREF9624_00862 [Oribacterium asaccharolyticum ACB7]|jgi:hypothetical protein|uniref:Uncharacterized protein n=1 Tax=Oribacterium asaccharolyticum ACB7 TaxID=796944 RepID=G9WVC8_9FIRM|nr:MULTISPECIES: hypothetical protein [Oribacterium]EGL37051.1 hypothetical protein HMPREF9124_0922 [Oribacterium sp. oral taxon 108 str. F0425]EHL11529.1 hypothetical protein HMPREF9624_00862 [Oribacterium asaccharolyticum ACB7]